MPVKLARIDDRLIHGQVVLGWVPHVRPDRIVVVNDRVAASDWERRFYTTSVPPDIKTSFFSIEEAARRLRSELFLHEDLLVLFESGRDVLTLVKAGVEVKDVNVGGLHYREDSVELLPFVFLTEDERSCLRELVKRGITLSAQDIPSNPARVINSLVV